MAITLGQNLTAFSTRMNLNKVTTSLSETMERLSSGLKINRSSDDAAGLVISENMEAVIRSSRQAMNNIQTAKSYLAVAEDGMVSISDHYQRINDLLTNMANGTNDINSNTAAVREIIERLEEINRLADSTNYNGKEMLDGTAGSIIVQIGGTADKETSTLDISAALSDCHVSTMMTTLPDNLNPDKADFNPNNENCRAYMKTVQEAIAQISTRRGLLGAYENRMESSYDSMTARIESLEEGKSVYTDTDIAEEATNMVQKQIMQQINVSVLTNANSMQSLALSLLGG